MNDKFNELLLREKPILETLLVRERSSSLKLLSKLRKIEKINNKIKR